jgi:DNA replication initiation complex subunit (GINS family)
MYNELYAAWRREIDDASLGGLPPDFYSRITDYLRHIKEEDKPLDKKTVKINLLDQEAQNVSRMLDELLKARYKKIVKTITQSQKIPSELLTVEEARICENFKAFTGAYKKFTKELLDGQVQIQTQAAPMQVQVAPLIVKVISEPSHKRVAVRLVKAIPAIIGADMKTYGPFKIEDVTSLPADNAKMLVKQGLAVPIEVS